MFNEDPYQRLSYDGTIVNMEKVINST